jgi:tRNA-splicing ligase RtcB
MSKLYQDSRLTRLNASELSLENDWQIPVRVFANPEIPIEAVALDEISDVLKIQQNVADIQAVDPLFFGADSDPRLLEVVLTPDFHKGAGIPIGTVLLSQDFAVPQAIGNDVNCGMRLMKTDISETQVQSRLPEIEKALRYHFFEGGRQIPLTAGQRVALLREGLPGLLDTAAQANEKGLWAGMDLAAEQQNLSRMSGQGGYPTDSLIGLEDYIAGSGGLSYDALIGTLGGGNHFAEIQVVRKLLDGAVAHAWGIKPGQVVVMIHSGSRDVGHITGRLAKEQMKALYPASLPHPANGLYPLPVRGRGAEAFALFQASMFNAANFTFGNRFFLAQMVRQSLAQVLGETHFEMIWDAPHNLMWQHQNQFLHRKGATPARGWEAVQNTAYAHWGEPVIVPGSMGSASYLLLGQNHKGALCSACHGAGRQLSRGEALQVDDAQLDAFLRDFRVVTALDPERPEIRLRRDILDKWRQDLKKEAPYAYKEITPVIQTLTDAGIARPVAELWPLVSIK